MSAPFTIIHAGQATPGAPAPRTPTALPHRGGAANSSVETLKARFPQFFVSAEVIWGETTVYIAPAGALEVVRWLHDDAGEQYDYLVDVTAVEYRDMEQPIEVVWHLRSIPYRRFLRVKAQLPKGEPLRVPSVYPVYKGADWLERECYDMFGIKFTGHPDLRRILLWEQYKEGFPLRKDFPLRGRFSRSEQLKNALSQDPEAKYSMEELSVAEAFGHLPEDMRKRLAGGEKVGE